MIHSDFHRCLNSLGNESCEVKETQQNMRNIILNEHHQTIPAVTPAKATGYELTR